MEIVISIFALLSGLGVFIIGMNWMSDNLETSADKGIAKLLNKMTSNKMAGVGVGLAVTAIIQSSSATTVMTIGFVNAGVMSLIQATTVVLGANIGTTVTGLISAFSIFDITIYLGALSAIGIFIKMFSKKEKISAFGGIIAGLGLIFIGLELMGSSFKTPEMANIMTSFFQTITFPILLVIVSTLLTAIIQSSSATIGILISMASANIIALDSSLFIVLGANIGTCITGFIASIGTNTDAKRTALIQLLFNLIGASLFTTFVWIFKSQVVHLLTTVIAAPTFQIAIFHTLFNLISVLIALPFVKYLVLLSKLIIKEKKLLPLKPFPLTYIDDLILNTPSVALIQTKKEIIKMIKLAKKNFKLSMNALFQKETAVNDDIMKNEKYINFLNESLTNYMIKLSSVNTITKHGELTIGAFHHVINDAERIGDYSVDLMEFSTIMIEKNSKFSKEAESEISALYEHVIKMYDLTIDVFSNSEFNMLKTISVFEEKTDQMQKEYTSNHFKRLHDKTCNVELGQFFYGITSSLERIADHLTNIAYSIKTPSGNEE